MPEQTCHDYGREAFSEAIFHENIGRTKPTLTYNSRYDKGYEKKTLFVQCTKPINAVEGINRLFRIAAFDLTYVSGSATSSQCGGMGYFFKTFARF